MNDFQNEETPAKDRKFVTALARGLEVLRAFRPGDGFLGNQEIAKRTGLPKPTVTRLTYTLTKLGYLAYSERLERYQLGTSVLALGYATLSNYGIRQMARPYMQELADEVDCAVSLGSRERLAMVYLETCRGSGAVTLRLDIGSRIPIATTAMGRAFLAAIPERERDYLMDYIKKRSGNEWNQVRQGIEHSLDHYEQYGYVKTIGEWERDVNSVGVPLVQTENGDVFAFNCGGPSFLLPEERLDEDLGPRLKQLVFNVQTALSRM
ncbi:IclR family transcriptional regulator [Alkalilimnicola ehrlichii]|uniref:IclR family transcriptional regulator n=1 Tax=Alkalilimnicola ehrlichii TaxID=351052 RepID=A0A3E0X2T3_9GAMM|nr:IclR family transcriptional regulator [Alkalilimnicola ehrlichii]RFA31377.1 IclR family transcriptional regulator [Alkalilimnicola ehrlichii]RFA39348.1 IclR family transcriptional regulator [Alkalilimnicola ehrlichii]